MLQLQQQQQQQQRPSGPKPIDMRGADRLDKFKGSVEHYPEWVAKLCAWVKMTNPAATDWLKLAAEKTGVITNDVIREMATESEEIPEALEEFSSFMYNLLIGCTGDEAFRRVTSVSDQNGLEAYRLRQKSYDPKTPGTKRAILKSIINNPQCKRVDDVEANLMAVESLIKKYESMTTNQEKLPDDFKITIMIDLCDKQLREHLEMSTRDLELIAV
jgi:hypothetical protein